MSRSSLGAKGIIECELVASGEKWGRGPTKDVHSSNRARIDSPAWRLVQALNTLVDPKTGDPAIDGLMRGGRVPSARRKKRCSMKLRSASMKRRPSDALGVKHWARDASWREALEDLAARPTVNIEGLVGGYTGPGGMTILPHRAAAKLDLRLVPDMTREDVAAKLKAHLSKRGFADIDVNVTGGYDPTTTPADARIVRAEFDVYRAGGIEPIFWPRRGGSWPGYIFTGCAPSFPQCISASATAHARMHRMSTTSLNRRIPSWRGMMPR